MILNVKKTNFFIYLGSLFCGVILIVTAIIIFCCTNCTIISNVLLGIGGGTIPTVVVAYLIDQANEKRESEKKEKLRDSFLWGMPHGLLWIVKVVTEEYYPFNNSNDKSFFTCFNEAISIMENTKPPEEDLVAYENERNRLMQKLDYGISLCVQNCRPILEHEYELQINSIFTKEQLLSIQYLFEECIRIKNSFVLSETAEYIKLFVQELYGTIIEIKERLDRTINIKERHIKNWNELVK